MYFNRNNIRYMRNKADKNKILEAAREMPIVKYILNKTGIPKPTFYRWINKDPVFKAMFDEAMDHGVEEIDDLSISKVIKGIHESKPWAIKYWRDHSHKRKISNKKEEKSEKNELEVDPDGPVRMIDALKRELSFHKTMKNIDIEKLKIEITARRAMRNMPPEGMAEEILFALTAKKRIEQENSVTQN